MSCVEALSSVVASFAKFWLVVEKLLSVESMRAESMAVAARR